MRIFPEAGSAPVLTAKAPTEGEEAEERERGELADELSAAMRANGRDPVPIREAMGG